MDIAQSFKTFFLSISLSFFQLWPKLLLRPPPPPPPPSPPTPDLEMEPLPPPPPSSTTTALEMQPLPPPPPPPSSTTTELEMQPLPPPPPVEQPLSASINLESQLVMNMGLAKKGLEWQNIIMAFCFTSALEIALQSAATQQKVDLPLSIYLLSFAITFIFASLFVSKFIANKFPTAARVFEKVAIFLAVTAFFFTISFPMPFIFKCAAWAIYLISLLIVAVCNFLQLST